ncbi:phage antirepressor KilAC domain-containing protein [Pseudomonas sp. LJDD11]|uniref:phage antirepressor KilAC domain-containing protein n=1 Tax=Pseudomonas sp. LJDD11 TaxID=2931984 RepID=UPI00211B82C2|nr:phage antirepressor KilAC domain-containing protein [Pseudomonas sp. LJDD11]MCQ9422699.1 phage antirepressor KilAC domain-containing protein [Pseudomonas sp. LJDD11]
MNRNLDATAAVLGIKPRTLRQELRKRGILTQTGDLAARHVGQGNLFADPRSRWNPAIRTYTHYSVVMVTEAGVSWVAKQLGITITDKSKDGAA